MKLLIFLKQKPWLELITIYTLMVLITVFSGVFDGLFGGIALLIVSLAFIYLPIEYLSYHKEPLEKYGLYEGGFTHPLGYLNALKKALFIALIVFPIYGIAYHELMKAQGIKPKWTWQSLSRWSEDLRDEPSDTQLIDHEILVFAIQDQIDIIWKLRENEQSISFEFQGIEKNQLKLKSATQRVDISTKGEATWVQTRRQSKLLHQKIQRLSFRYLPTTLRLSIKIDQKEVDDTRIKTGALKKASSFMIEESKSLHWIWQILLIQLFLVAFPEEIFYRGYLQSKLDQLLHTHERKILGIDFNWASALICSILFAIAHFATIPNPARLSVFFPSLLFGWMRRAYISVVPVAIFHALCNLYSQFLWGIYFN